MRDELGGGKGGSDEKLKEKKIIKNCVYKNTFTSKSLKKEFNLKQIIPVQNAVLRIFS